MVLKLYFLFTMIYIVQSAIKIDVSYLLSRDFLQRSSLKKHPITAQIVIKAYSYRE